MSSAVPRPVSPRYVLHASIGQGGMGAVFQATDRLTGQRVALKRVRLLPGSRSGSTHMEALSQTTPAVSALTELARTRPEGIGATSSAEHLRAALAQEFRILAALRHPHIISVLDFGFDPDRQPFFTMELLAGARSLRRAARDLPQPTRILLLLQLLQALSYLHHRGIIHRDLKPSSRGSEAAQA